MDSDSQDDSANLEIRCIYQSVCEFGKNVSEHPEGCVFYKQYERRRLELLTKEQFGIISYLERMYLRRLSGDVE